MVLDWLGRFSKGKEVASVNSFTFRIENPGLLFEESDDKHILVGFNFKTGLEFILKSGEGDDLLIALILSHNLITSSSKLLKLLFHFYHRFQEKEAPDFSERVILAIDIWFTSKFSDFEHEKMKKNLKKLFLELDNGDEKEVNWHEVIKESWKLQKSESELFNEYYELYTELVNEEFDIRNFSSIEIAQQLTFIDMKYFFKLRIPELFDFNNWEDPDSCPNICAMNNWYNRLAQWVPTIILKENDEKMRYKLIKKLVSIAEKSLSLQNYNSFMAITSGLNDFTVSRMVFHACKERFEKITEISSPLHAFQNIRDLYETAIIPFVPPQVVLFRDTAQINFTIKTVLNDDIFNAEKLISLSKVAAIIESNRRAKYEIVPDGEIIHYFYNIEVASPQDLEELSSQISSDK